MSKKIIINRRNAIYPIGGVLVGVGDIKKRYYAFLDNTLEPLKEGKAPGTGLSSLLQLFNEMKKEDCPPIHFWTNGAKVPSVFHGDVTKLFKEYFASRAETFENIGYLAEEVNETA